MVLQNTKKLRFGNIALRQESAGGAVSYTEVGADAGLVRRHVCLGEPRLVREVCVIRTTVIPCLARTRGCARGGNSWKSQEPRSTVQILQRVARILTSKQEFPEKTKEKNLSETVHSLINECP